MFLNEISARFKVGLGILKSCEIKSLKKPEAVSTFKAPTFLERIQKILNVSLSPK